MRQHLGLNRTDNSKGITWPMMIVQQTLLEVNGVPGWQRIAAVSGIDVASRIIRYLKTRGTGQLISQQPITV